MRGREAVQKGEQERVWGECVVTEAEERVSLEGSRSATWEDEEDGGETGTKCDVLCE